MTKAFLAAFLSAAVLLSAQARFKDTEWPTHGADLAASRYRPLDQINASNFSKLEIAWRFKTDSIGNRPEFKLEGTPLMINGVLYATAGSRRAAIALAPRCSSRHTALPFHRSRITLLQIRKAASYFPQDVPGNQGGNSLSSGLLQGKTYSADKFA